MNSKSKKKIVSTSKKGKETGVKPRRDTELDSILRILDSPIRRLVIQRLSQEPNYPLQLAKDLNLSQQLVAKHLKIMEKAQLVESAKETSPQGPKRRIYFLNKSLAIMVNIGPHLFKEKVIAFDVEPDQETLSEKAAAFLNRVKELFKYPKEERKIDHLAEILTDIDEHLDYLEEETLVLLYIRNSVMKETRKMVQQIDSPDARRVLHHAIDSHDDSIRRISEVLNLREATVKEIISELKASLDTTLFE